MTEYMWPQDIYDRTLKELIETFPSEAECAARIEELQVGAAHLLERMKRPDWSDPFVSFIPNYGVDVEIHAIDDFHRLRPLLVPGSLSENFLRRRICRR